MFGFFAQFLPDDDEAASMFTVVIDKEIAQQEKKKKIATAAGTCYCQFQIRHGYQSKSR